MRVIIASNASQSDAAGARARVPLERIRVRFEKQLIVGGFRLLNGSSQRI